VIEADYSALETRIVMDGITVSREWTPGMRAWRWTVMEDGLPVWRDGEETFAAACEAARFFARHRLERLARARS